MYKDDRQDPSRHEKRRFLAGLATGVLIAVVVIGAVMVGPDLLRYASLHDAGSRVSMSMLSPRVRAKVRNLVDIIDTRYYQEVDEEDFFEGLYAGLFTGLDKYSIYYSKKDYQSEMEDFRGVFAGIGVGLIEDAEGRIYVTQVYEGSPAEEAGIQRGDELIQADSWEAKNMDLEEFVGHVKGEEGSSVELTVRRVLSDNSDAADESNVKTFTCTVKRAQIEIPTVLTEMLSDDIGYLQIGSFTSQTDEQFEEGVKKLQKEGMEKLIIDLRDNGGGDFDAACDALDEVLPAGLMIYTEDRNGKRQEINGTDEDVLDVPIVILVNGNTASSSEVFSAGLKDQGYATLVGTRTFGKGILQNVYQLPDGSGFQITTQRYFTAKGYSVQDEGGIEPDVEIEYEYSGDQSGPYDKLKDNQVLKAMEILDK